VSTPAKVTLQRITKLVEAEPVTPAQAFIRTLSDAEVLAAWHLAKTREAVLLMAASLPPTPEAQAAVAHLSDEALLALRERALDMAVDEELEARRRRAEEAAHEEHEEHEEREEDDAPPVDRGEDAPADGDNDEDQEDVE
jgi:hypothetical protein